MGSATLRVQFSNLHVPTQTVRKYHSVPVLRLVPSDRPLFFCDNCCSANFYVPMCLWCKWTSAAAKKNFEKKTPRGRTISAPRLFSTGLESKAKKDRLRGTTALEKADPRGSLDTDRSTEPPETPRSMCLDNTSSGITTMDEWVKISVDEAALVSLVDPSGPLYNFDLTFSCDSLSSAQPKASGQPLYDPYHGGQLRHKGVRPPTPKADTNRGSIISFNRSAYLPWSDDGHAYESQSFFSDDESQGFRRSTDSRCSGTKSEGHVPRLAHSPTRMRSTIARSPSPPPSFHRRPLYHHIRNRSSTSQSTFDCGAVPEISRPVTPQHGASHPAQPPTRAAHARVDEIRVDELRLPSIASFSGKGFSLSGETEQKMDLARIVHDGRFIFHENKPTRKRDRIMRGFRRSFKSFFNSKSDR